MAASLPCYSATNVDEQRGRGVFDRSIMVSDPIRRKSVTIDPHVLPYSGANFSMTIWRHLETASDTVSPVMASIIAPLVREIQYRCFSLKRNVPPKLCHPCMLTNSGLHRRPRC